MVKIGWEDYEKRGDEGIKRSGWCMVSFVEGKIILMVVGVLVERNI